MTVKFASMQISMDNPPEGWFFHSKVEIEGLALKNRNALVVQRATLKRLQSGRELGTYGIDGNTIICHINVSGPKNFQKEVMEAFDRWRRVKQEMQDLYDDINLLDEMDALVDKLD